MSEESFDGFADSEAREHAEYLRQIEVDDFQWLMADKRGRRLVWRLLGLTRVFKSSFTGNSQTFFFEGTRDVGLKVLGELNEICPEKYVLMLKENTDNGSRNNRTRKH